jgi:LPPG:FO 2-phospho-L-lactate transferase
VVTALAGGVGAARLMRGLVEVVPPSDLAVVVNTGDDAVIHGLHVSPDLDTITYTLAGRNDEDRGWGLARETWTVMDALEELGGETWFRLGDRDLATHLYRTHRMGEGATLSEVTAELAGRQGVAVRILPMSDDKVRTRLTLAHDGEEVAFQDYFVRLHHDVAVSAVRFEGADRALPAPGVVDAIQGAESVVICPSNPVVSIGPILSLPAIAAAVRAKRLDVVAVSPIVGGRALRGPADRMLVELGEDASALGVARRYAELIGTLVVDEVDEKWSDAIEALGVRCIVAPTVMHGLPEAVALARVVLDRVPGGRENRR